MTILESSFEYFSTCYEEPPQPMHTRVKWCQTFLNINRRWKGQNNEIILLYYIALFWYFLFLKSFLKIHWPTLFKRKIKNHPNNSQATIIFPAIKKYTQVKRKTRQRGMRDQREKGVKTESAKTYRRLSPYPCKEILRLHRNQVPNQ